ncbi:MAG: MarR family transcriptional regulator [Emcibacteraceae bacterium]|nr:MarR family transcriptional regulator [Emcibacteraceae bacterium]
MNNNSTDKGSCNKTRLLSRMISNSNRLTQDLNQRMKQETSLSIAKYDVLRAIEKADGGKITMSNLSKELLVSNANMTGMTSRLQADGLVNKKVLPSDRRIYSVELTSEGKIRLEKASKIYDLWTKELMANIDNNEVIFMNGLLDKLDRQTDDFSKAI